jgi:hypothetical protein
VRPRCLLLRPDADDYFVVDLVAWNFALAKEAETQAFLFNVTLIVDVVVCPTPTPAVNFETSWKVAGLTPTLLFSVNVFAVVDVAPLFHLIVPVLLEPVLDDAIVVVQFWFLYGVVALLVPPVMPVTPLQPPSVALRVTFPLTFVATPSFGSGLLHVSVPANVLHFGGNGPAAPAGPAVKIPTDAKSDAANNSPSALRM